MTRDELEALAATVATYNPNLDRTDAIWTAAREYERAQGVAWLRAWAKRNPLYETLFAYIAEAFERGDHTKGDSTNAS